MAILRDLGRADYEPTFAAMRAFTDARDADTPDELWIVEHPPVFTLGLGADRGHVLADHAIPVVQTDRGGEVTYHGPGQVVIYLLMDLRRNKPGGKLYARQFVGKIEQAVIDVLAAYNLAGERVAGAPGIYMADGPSKGAKIAALGLKVRGNGCTYHGVSLNVAMDLAPFSWINPCGYAGLVTVDMRSMGARAELAEVQQALAASLVRHLSDDAVPFNFESPPTEPTRASCHMTTDTDTSIAPAYNASDKQKGASKTSRIPIKIVPIGQIERLKKPDWIRVKAASASTRFYEIKDILRANNLVTVCEEASCPNIGECFGKGTATFMIMGDKCTRRCPFCDVGHGRPDPLDTQEPDNLAKTIAELRLSYVVITSVDRDDLRDGGAGHFVDCIQKTRALSPNTRIEVLVPDFRGRLAKALAIFADGLPDVMNHNLETVPRLYKEARPGSDYTHSLELLRDFKALYPNAVTKSGIMVGLGETDEEILQVMRDLRSHNVDMLTIGQYLAPSGDHLPVRRYVHPDVFKMFEAEAYKMGFVHAAVGAMVRSSYHADEQAHNAGVTAISA